MLDKYKDIKFAIMYGDDTLTLDLVVSGLRSKYLKIQVCEKDDMSDSVLVRATSEKRNKGYRGKSKGKSK